MQELCLTEAREDFKAIKIISPVYAGRTSLLTAVLQYVYQTIRLGGSGMVEEGRALEMLGGEKLRDFEALGALITKLGASPVFTASPLYPVSYHSCANVDYAKSYPAMLAADIRLEQALIKEFEGMRSQLENDVAAELIGRMIEHAKSNLASLQNLLEQA